MRLSVILILGALSCSGASAQVMGSVLPPGALKELSNTEARTFADYEGRCVLLEFFAYW